MDEPLSPFLESQSKHSGPGSSKSSLFVIPRANSDTFCSLILYPLTIIGFLIKGDLTGQIWFSQTSMLKSDVWMLSLCLLFQAFQIRFSSLSVYFFFLFFCHFQPNHQFKFLYFPSNIPLWRFSSLFLKTPSTISFFLHFLSLHPLLFVLFSLSLIMLLLAPATGEIILWLGSPAPRGFNPAMGFLNLLMETGIKALDYANKHRLSFSLKREQRERERRGELWDLLKDNNICDIQIKCHAAYVSLTRAYHSHTIIQ